MAYAAQQSPADTDAYTASLVRAYQHGDQAAFDEIRRLHYDVVAERVRAGVSDVDDPAYVTERVFIRARGGLARLQPCAERPLRAWLLRLARRTILDARAHQLRAPRSASLR
jgi:DNA-directed RNA polymerase specialized sigma24 family protein